MARFVQNASTPAIAESNTKKVLFQPPNDWEDEEMHVDDANGSAALLRTKEVLERKVKKLKGIMGEQEVLIDQLRAQLSEFHNLFTPDTISTESTSASFPRPVRSTS